MTTIAAIAHEGSVFMAADTMTNVYDRPIYTARKIRTISLGSKDALIGVAGDGAFMALLSELDIADPAEDPEQVAAALALAITDLAVQRGLVQDGRMDGTALLGYSGRLWTLTHAQAIRHDDGTPEVAALGSGEGPAMGAMHAFLEAGRPPAKALMEAMAVAVRLDRYSGGEVVGEILPRAE